VGVSYVFTLGLICLVNQIKNARGVYHVITTFLKGAKDQSFATGLCKIRRLSRHAPSPSSIHL